MNSDAERPSESLEADERKWKLIATKAEVARTIAISIIGTAIAAIFYLYQENQTQSRYYADLQSQRERSDTDLRAQMFNTLFQNYFKAKIESSARASARNAGERELTDAQLDDLRQEIVLSDLLARNFDAVDVRPIFEDIDRRLTQRIDAGREGQEAIADQRKAFQLREQLRRVARGATSRQTASLVARAKAGSQQLVFEQCEGGDGKSPEITPDLLPPLPHGVKGVIEQVSDNSVSVSFAHSALKRASSKTGTITTPERIPVSVTFYDMPALENIRLPGGERAALTLTRFISAQTCERFWMELDESTRNDCSPMLADANNKGRYCSRATVTLTIIPSTFIGARDRPYLNELVPSKGVRASLLPALDSGAN
jgi:hypothetical protein